MEFVTLGSTDIKTNKNGFGALPVQRVSEEYAAFLLQKAFDKGIRFFDTARDYTDSEKKVGIALSGRRKECFIATKTHAITVEKLRSDLEESLRQLQTDYVDIYQFHQAKACYKPGDGTGLYETMMEFKNAGKVRHIGITTHMLSVAEEAIESGLYETLQFPLSYISEPQDIDLVRKCREHNMGFIAMKGMAGGLITNSRAAYAFMRQFENLIPIWGIQREKELDEFLSYQDDVPDLTSELEEIIKKDKAELAGNFCRGCGYCLPCPAGIEINMCARMSLFIRRAPSAPFLSEAGQARMKKIEGCLHCNQCKSRCPYGLDTPELLQRNYEDYRKILSGEIVL